MTLYISPFVLGYIAGFFTGSVLVLVGLTLLAKRNIQ